MIRPLHKLWADVAWTAALSLLFFLLYYLYLWLLVDLRLIYHGGGIILGFPVFYREWYFFRQSVSWPGGFVGYISAFLAQFFSIGWLGALVATAQAWLLWLCTRSILRVAGGRRPEWICFVVPILLLMLYARYTYPFGIAMDVLAALGFVCLYFVMASKRKLTDLPAFLVLLVILYAIAGVACLLFAVLCAIYEMLVRRRWLVGVMYLVAAPIVSCLEGLLVFDMNVIYALRHFQFFSHEAGTVTMAALCIRYIFYLFLPVALVGSWLLGFLGVAPDPSSGQHSASGTPPASAEKGEKTEDKPPGRFAVWNAGIFTGEVALLLYFMIGIIAVNSSHSDKLKTVLEIDYYSGRRMWPEVLQVAGQNPAYGIANYAVNRALYHTGRLAEDMFDYPQHPGSLFLADKTNEAAYWELSDTFIYPWSG